MNKKVLKKMMVTGLTVTSLLPGLTAMAYTPEQDSSSIPIETAIENNVDFNIEVGRLFGNRVINRTTALLNSPGGAALTNLPAGTRVQARGQSGNFVNVLITSGANAGRIGWVARNAIQ